jgi:hypothetical protein
MVRVAMALTGALSVTAGVSILRATETSQAEDGWARFQRATTAVFSINARLLDPALPDAPFLEWLQNAVGRDSKVWIGGYNSCDGDGWTTTPPSNPETPWNVCAQMTATLSDDRSVSIALAASVVPDRDRPGDWRPSAARLSSAYVLDGRRDSLDVPTLHQLPETLAIPVGRWPHAELQITQEDLRIEPTSFKAGDRVTVVVTVHNVGAELARVRVAVGGAPECSDIGNLLTAPLSGKISAGEQMTWRVEITVPDWPRWWLSALADLMPVSQMIRKYQMTPVTKSASKPIGPLPFRTCSVPHD